MARSTRFDSTLIRSRLAGCGRDVPAHGVERLLRHCLNDAADAAGALAVRPDLQLDWPSTAMVPAPVAAAVADALATSLAQIARHRGVTSAFASVAWRSDAVEVCVVDDGHAPRAGFSETEDHQGEANGVAHDVDDYGDVGICQWWSIPLDLG